MALGRFSFPVTAANDGQTVKTFLRRECGLSARSMTVLKYTGAGITRSGDLLRAHDLLREGDIVEIALPGEVSDVEPVQGELNILFEDDRLLIVDKPAGMPVHPTKIHQLDTLANLVAFYQRSREEAYTFRALNRLDKDTSGIVLIAKDRITYMLVQPTVRKVYCAVCEGMITEAGTVDLPIALAEDSKIKRCVSQNGTRAITHYEPVAWGDDHTMLRLRLETGRTHQIRCHMSSLGHPLAGDDLYGGSLRYIRRQALHCAEVLFVHPDTHEEIKLCGEIPAELTAFI